MRMRQLNQPRDERRGLSEAYQKRDFCDGGNDSLNFRSSPGPFEMKGCWRVAECRSWLLVHVAVDPFLLTVLASHPPLIDAFMGQYEWDKW